MTAAAVDRAARRLLEVVPDLRDRWGVPGVAVAVVAEEAVYTAGFGVTNVEHPLGVDGRTLFQIGSVSKTFTATLVMQDVEAGRLDLDAPVRAIVPELRLADEDVAARVTARHLLTHRAGFVGDELLITGSVRPGGRSLAEGIAALAGVRQVFGLDTVTSYNNAGFTILGHMTEVLAGGASWPELLAARVLAPAGMTHTFTRADEVVTHRVAAGHVGNRVLRDGGWQRGWELCDWDVPVGGIVSCADDLAGWLQLQLRARRSPTDDAGGILAAGTLAAMHEPQVAWGSLADAVGLCWWIRDVGGVLLIGHGGQTAGYETDVGFVPARGVGYAILTNAVGSGSALARDLRREILRSVADLDDPPPAADPDLGVDVDAICGVYELPLVRVTVEAAGDGHIALTSERPPGAEVGWYPPPPPPATAALHAPDRAVLLSPPESAGTTIDFGRIGDGPTRWMRRFGRAGPRQHGGAI